MQNNINLSKNDKKILQNDLNSSIVWSEDKSRKVIVYSYMQKNV